MDYCRLEWSQVANSVYYFPVPDNNSDNSWRLSRQVNRLELRYGREDITLEIPGKARLLAFREPSCEVTKVSFLSGLRQLLEGRSVDGEVAVLVADKTRLCGYPRILPWVLETLTESGVPKERITFYISYGTHARQTEEECYRAYGEVYGSHRFVHHECLQDHIFQLLGVTPRGTRVEVRRDVIESELILSIGAVSHHYFAGYGGGRKLLFPGLAAKDGIYANHKLFLDRTRDSLAAGCWPGQLEGNPLAEDLLDIHNMLPDYLSIHAILDSSGKPAQYTFGRNYQDFLEVCRDLDRCYRLETAEQFDLVVASAGGYPKDINMIQVHKAVHNAANLVRDGGTLLMLAECADGIGSETFLPYFRLGGWQNTFQALQREYVGNGGTALAMMEKTERINICMLTSLSAEICSRMGVSKVSAAAVQQMIAGHASSCAVVRNSSLLVTGRM